MQIGMMGLGRMGANMVRRLLKGGHECVVFNRPPKPVTELAKEGAVGTASLAEFAKRLTKPRVVWRGNQRIEGPQEPKGNGVDHLH